MALCVFLRILFTELAVLTLTNKGRLKTISWHIIQFIKGKFQETELISSHTSTLGTEVGLWVLKYVYSMNKNVKKFTSCYHTLSILMNWEIFLLLIKSNGNCESQFTKQYFFFSRKATFLATETGIVHLLPVYSVGSFNNTFRFYEYIINRSCKS